MYKLISTPDVISFTNSSIWILHSLSQGDWKRDNCNSYILLVEKPNNLALTCSRHAMHPLWLIISISGTNKKRKPCKRVLGKAYHNIIGTLFITGNNCKQPSQGPPRTNGCHVSGERSAHMQWHRLTAKIYYLQKQTAGTGR